MIKAQEWLDKNYPKKNRKVLLELNLRNLNLEGDLDLEGFPYGLKVYLTGNPRLGKIKNKPLLAAFIYRDPQEYLNYKYPRENKIKEINFSFLDFDQAGELLIDDYPDLKKIIGRNTSNVIKVTISNCPQLEKVNIGGFINTYKLILDNLPNLIHLDCPYNKLKSLDLGEFYNLREVYCQNNYLTEINLPNLGENLEVLWLSDNDFNQDLAFLNHLVNLKHLDLRNNRFRGSLEFLKDMSKLEKLNISNTDIDNGLEYLLDSVEDFSCSADKRKDAKVRFIEEIYQYLNYNPKRIKEFVSSSAQQWIEQNYPENGVCQRKTEDKGWDNSSGWNNEQKTRAEITHLDISGQELRGWLRLKRFINLKKLNCSNNQLVYLDLTDCTDLIDFKCDNNEFRKLDFLKSLSNLEKLWIQNNSKLFNKNLSFFTPFKKLKELDVSNCPFEGSLKPLENLYKLERISISFTDISEGLEDLPENCKEIYCELDYNSKAMEIIKELGKLTKEENTNWYNLNKWRKDQANNKVTSSISLERLFVIRSNIKQFINKWGKKKDSGDNSELKSKLVRIVDSMKELEKKVIVHRQGSELTVTQPSVNTQTENQSTSVRWYTRFIEKENNLSELEQLCTPEEYGKFRYLGGVKWVARATAVTGGVLALADQPVIGGAMAAASPFIDAIANHIEENYYQKREEKWKEFQNDADTLLDNYHELLGITKSIKIGEVGEINVTFRSLKKEVNDFLKEFDKDGNEEIDVKELVDKRELLFKPWHEIQSDNIPQTQTHEYVIPIEKQFYEQFAQTHQKETFSFWSKFSWNKNEARVEGDKHKGTNSHEFQRFADNQVEKDENSTSANPSVTRIKKRISHIRSSSDKETTINLEESSNGKLIEKVIEIPAKK